MSNDALFRLPARSITAVLSELAALRNRARSGEPLDVPTVTLWLAAGQSVRGDVIALADANQADFTVLLKHPTALEATYIAGSAIQGVTVHLTVETTHLLSFGKFRSLTEPVPTRLDLERFLRSLTTQLNPTTPLTGPISWDEFPSTDAAMQQLGDVLNHLRSALLTIQADALGATALGEQVQRLDVRVHSQPGVILQAGILTVQVQILDHELVTLPQVELLRAIERLL
jgi:hypothetical protein